MTSRLLAALFLVLCFGHYALAASPEERPEQDHHEITTRLLEHLSLENVNQFVSTVNQELDDSLPALNEETISQIMHSGLTMDWRHIFSLFIHKLFEEIIVNTGLMGKLLCLAVFCALLQNLQNSFEQSGISLLAYSICYVFMMIIVFSAVYNILSFAGRTIGTMVNFMEAILPVLISLMAGMGGVTSAALFTPLMLFVVNAIGVIVQEVVLPLLLLTCALECVNYLSEKYRVKHLANLFKQSGMLILSFTLVLFVGVITVQGLAGSIADGLTLRAAKFATSTFVPVVGGVFSDAVGTVMGASLLLKNAVGIFGVLVIVTICVMPVIKLLALILIMKMSGALIQPMGDEKMAECLTAIGNHLLLIFGAVATVALMFFLSITMIIGVSSMTVMLGR